MMIELLFILAAVLVVLFSFVLLFGAPYLPTLSTQAEAALDLVDLKPGEHLLELGCGDGKVMIAAAKRGLRVTGYELNPLLAAIAWVRTRRYGKRVKVVCGNFWNIKLPVTEGIFVFLLPKYMSRLDTKIAQESSKPVKLVSFAFKIPNMSITKENQGVFLYRYK